MKKALLYLFTLVIFSCSSDDPETGSTNNNGGNGSNQSGNDITLTSLEISSATTTLLANGIEEINFQVVAYDQNQTVIPNPTYQIFANNVIVPNNNFKTTIPGNYYVIARSGSVESNTIALTATQVPVASISIDSNTKLIIADNLSTAQINVSFYDANNNQLNNVAYDVFDNGSSYPNDLEFKTNVSGVHGIYIVADGIQSNTLSINARINPSYSPISIPVVFHIVHFGESIGSGTNLTSPEVDDMLLRLNNGFSNQYGSSNPNAIDTNISFRLATINPSNQNIAQPGINRLDATLYDIGSTGGGPDIAGDQKLGPNEMDNLGADSFWNPREYLNIWIHPDQNNDSAAGLPRTYASNPLDGLDTVPDGCQCDASNVFYQSCKVNTASALNGTTIIHEVGHVFGLKHVFSIDGCTTSDYCQDTFSYIFNNTAQECSDNLGTLVNDNFMDYTGSYTTFTYDQSERMHHVFEYGLWFNELKNSTK